MPTVVVKVGTSSITSERGELDDASLLQAVPRARRRARRRPRGRAGVLGRDRRRAARARDDHASHRHRHAAGRSPRSASPGSWSGSAPSSPSTACSPVRSCSPRTTSGCARSTCTPARPCAASSTSASCRSSTRTTPSPTTRSATATTTASPRSSRTSCGADVLVLLTDTPGLFTADPRLDAGASLIEEIVEVDAALEALAGGTGTDRGSGGMATKLAAAKIAAWSGVRAVIAAADAPDVVRDAIAGRAVGTVVLPRARAAPEPEAVDRVRPGRRRAGRGRRRRPPRSVFGQPLSAACRGPRRRGRVRGRRRGRDRRRHRRAVRERAWSGTPRPCCAAWPAARPPSCRRGCRTRSSTATTSSCCPDPRRCLERAPALPREPRFRHTLASRARRRPAGGESSHEGFDGRRGAGGR